MGAVLHAAYFCGECQVAGRSADAAPRCWCCGGEVTVTARVSPLPDQPANLSAPR
jgi:hypothetical protein